MEGDSDTYGNYGTDDESVMMSQNRIVRPFEAGVQLGIRVILHVLECLAGECQSTEFGESGVLVADHE